jgi:predicted nucleotidyltransferase
VDKQSVVKRLDASLLRFAGRLRDVLRAERVLLFGSYARGTDYYDSDYDLIIVSEHFRTIAPLDRQIGLREMFYDVGGNAPMDLICLTPEEFESARGRATLVSAVLPEAIDLLSPEATPA